MMLQARYDAYDSHVFHVAFLNFPQKFFHNHFFNHFYDFLLTEI